MPKLFERHRSLIGRTAGCKTCLESFVIKVDEARAPIVATTVEENEPSTIATSSNAAEARVNRSPNKKRGRRTNKRIKRAQLTRVRPGMKSLNASLQKLFADKASAADVRAWGAKALVKAFEYHKYEVESPADSVDVRIKGKDRVVARLKRAAAALHLA